MKHKINIINNRALAAAKKMVDLLNEGSDELVEIDRISPADKFIFYAVTLEHVLTYFVAGFEDPLSGVGNFFSVMQKSVIENLNSMCKFLQGEI